jgi:hypothetical protein
LRNDLKKCLIPVISLLFIKTITIAQENIVASLSDTDLIKLIKELDSQDLDDFKAKYKYEEKKKGTINKDIEVLRDKITDEQLGEYCEKKHKLDLGNKKKNIAACIESIEINLNEKATYLTGITKDELKDAKDDEKKSEAVARIEKESEESNAKECKEFKEKYGTISYSEFKSDYDKIGDDEEFAFNLEQSCIKEFLSQKEIEEKTEVDKLKTEQVTIENQCNEFKRGNANKTPAEISNEISKLVDGSPIRGCAEAFLAERKRDFSDVKYVASRDCKNAKFVVGQPPIVQKIEDIEGKFEKDPKYKACVKNLPNGEQALDNVLDYWTAISKLKGKAKCLSQEIRNKGSCSAIVECESTEGTKFYRPTVCREDYCNAFLSDASKDNAVGCVNDVTRVPTSKTRAAYAPGKITTRSGTTSSK